MITKRQIHRVGVLVVAAIAVLATQLAPAQAHDYGASYGNRNSGTSMQIQSGYSNYGRNSGYHMQVGPSIGYSGTNLGMVPRYPAPPHYVPNDSASRLYQGTSGYSGYRPNYGNGRCH